MEMEYEYVWDKETPAGLFRHKDGIGEAWSFKTKDWKECDINLVLDLAGDHVECKIISEEQAMELIQKNLEWLKKY